MTTKQFRRSVAVDTPDFIEEKDERIIELAFSSEAPYTRYYMNQDGEQVELKEILVHDESAVDLSVLNETNASLLFNHNLDLHIGKIVPGSARIDEDRVGRCLVQFSKVGQLANECFEKVKEGTLSQVSVGYNILDGKADFNKGIYYVTRWQPFECSLVTCAADPFNAGVGRSLNTDNEMIVLEGEQVEDEIKDTPVEEIKPEDEEKRSEDEPEEEIKPEETEELNKDTDENDETENTSEAVEEEKIEDEEKPFERSREDTAEIRAIGKHLNISEDVIEAAIKDSAVTIENFKEKARALNTTESKTFVKGKITMTDTIKTLESRFDLNKAVRAIAEGKALTGAEAEYSQEEARKAAARGRAQRSNSVFIPASALRASQNMESLKPVVGEEIRHDCFVDMILERSILGKLGVRTINATGPVSLPSLTSSNLENFGFVAEGQSAGEGTIKFAAQPMTLKTFNGIVPVTRQAAITLPNIGAIVGEHMLKHSAIALEKAILSNAANTNARDGLTKILTDAGKVKQIDWTYAEFLKLVAELTDKGYNEADLAFATRGVVKAELAAQLKAANVQGFLVEGDKLVNRPIYGSGVVAQDTMLFGDFSSLVVADFGSLELDCDDTTGRAAGNLYFRVWADLDWAVMDHSALTVVQKKVD
ncbi:MULTISPECIES: phage major capsid protein [Escherichia]|uniref:phage major capsid family protein n=1 Tax=Escherichia TaxID=561 RepID=UPI000DD5AEE1|nr:MULTISPECIES: phage major capsid protein [Escherichia]MQS21564.1 hypothetical protein [Escherichia coli]UZX08114.1 hypothetical protein HeN100_13555 [Escherichia coli]